MQLYEVVTFIICLAALFSYINFRFIKWPPTIGIMALSLVFSVCLIFATKLFPGNAALLVNTIRAIDFHSLLMNVMLSFLLFAGSIHIDASSLKKERAPVIVLSTVGIFISTALIGTLLYYLFPVFHLQVAFIYCLLFAALISPTDPIAVLAILKKSGLPKSLELKISGESLFNDGVAVVVFVTILEVAQTGIDRLTVSDIALLFMREAGGGLLFGILLGYAGFFALRSIDKYEVEVLITIAMVMGGYLAAQKLHVSGPLAIVVAGIITGNKARSLAVSDHTLEYMNKFWELADEMLNAVLFLLIGFEMLVIKMDIAMLAIGLIAILIVLLARWISVALPIAFLRKKMTIEKNAISILTWGGLRGGLSVALALSLPPDMYKDQFVSITYIVVVFSILVQGLTIGSLYRRLERKRR
jgi:CPA1 family monovalent cation:H+ antiporter